MRKTSQDGGDTTSITSGIENEIKKSATGIAKIKRSSIKKKVQSFSHESDDGVIEPLLQKDKKEDKTEFPSHSAKLSVTKTKTDVISDTTGDRDKLLPDNKVEKLPLTSFSAVTENRMNGTSDGYTPYICTTNSIRNHMNTNVFSNAEVTKNTAVPKSKILVEIEGNKPGSYSSGPLIFTTAKIHTDGRIMQMEPVQVTPVPILSTIEGSVIKTGATIDNQKVDLGTSGTCAIISSDVKKTSEEIKKGDLNLKTSTGIISNKKQETNLSDLSKSVSDAKKSLNDFHSKATLIPSSVTKISDNNVAIMSTSKGLNSTTLKQADGKQYDIAPIHTFTKDVPSVQGTDKKSVIEVKEDAGVTKKNQLPTCSTLPIIDSVIEKDIERKNKNDSNSMKLLQRQQNATDSHNKPESKKQNNLTDSKTTVTDKIPSTSKVQTGIAEEPTKEINRISGTTPANTSSKTSLPTTQDKVLKPVAGSLTKTNSSNDKFIITISSTMPSNSTITTMSSKVAHTTATTVSTNTKTIFIDCVVKKIPTCAVNSMSITSSPVEVTSVSKKSSDPKSKLSTKAESMNSPVVTSASNIIKTAPKNVAVNTKSNSILSGKSTTKSIASETAKHCETTSSGKSSLIKLIPTSPSSVTSTVTPTTNVSTNSSIKLNSATPNKLDTSKAQNTGVSSKGRNPITTTAATSSSTQKPMVAVSKTPQTVSSSQTSATSTKPSDSSSKVGSGTSGTVSKTTTPSGNIGKTSDSQSVLSKAPLNKSIASPATVVTTTSQKPISINKSTRSNENKKEKLK